MPNINIFWLIIPAIGTGILTYELIRRLIKNLVCSKQAKIHIGTEVSVRSDEGAWFAYRGVYFYFRENHAKALRCFERALKNSYITQNNAFCYDWMSRCYTLLDKQAEALEYSLKAARAEPTNAKVLFNLCDIYVKQGGFKKAEYYYEQVLRYDEGNVMAHFMLGVLFMGRGLYDKAEKTFVEITQKHKSFSSAFAELSVLMAIKGDYSQMDSYYNLAKNHNYLDWGRLEKRLNSIKDIRETCGI